MRGIIILNFGIIKGTVWLKLNIKNLSQKTLFYIDVEYPILDQVSFYQLIDDETYEEKKYTQGQINQRAFIDPNYIFEINIPQNTEKTFYINISSIQQIILPIMISTDKQVWMKKSNRNLLNGIYAGLVIIMVLYNLFIYLSTRDRSYLYYVGYVLFIGLTQLWIKGFSVNYFFNLSVNISALTICASIACIMGLLFTVSFLKTKENSPKLHIGLVFLSVPLLISIVFSLTNIPEIGFMVMQFSTALFSIYVLIVSYYLVFKKYRPAYYFTAAWTILLVGSIVFLLKDAGILPYNFYTSYSMQLASGLEMTILSFALADRINFYRKEKDQAKANEIEALQENEQLVMRQNLILEARVKERTDQLEKLNNELQQTLVDFETSQKELIKSEKMASLGQLTAGVAHEINNPINFVSSNIEPLKRDLNDLFELIKLYESTSLENYPDKIREIEAYKAQIDYHYLLQELNQIISGIEDGAKRTSEIVQGLRTFSRSDSKSKVPGNVNDGIKATITLIQSKLDGIKLELSLGKLPEFLCFPSKLNQVFMNMLNNAIDAVSEQQHGKQPYIKVSTHFDSAKNCVIVQFTDNGCGIPDELASKIFDPFYTTKPVGKGTGLGLSISYQLIELHNGTISFESDSEKGTTFTIVLPA